MKLLMWLCMAMVAAALGLATDAVGAENPANPHHTSSHVKKGAAKPGATTSANRMKPSGKPQHRKYIDQSNFQWGATNNSGLGQGAAAAGAKAPSTGEIHVSPKSKDLPVPVHQPVVPPPSK